MRTLNLEELSIISAGNKLSTAFTVGQRGEGLDYSPAIYLALLAAGLGSVFAFFTDTKSRAPILIASLAAGVATTLGAAFILDDYYKAGANYTVLQRG